MFNKINTKNGNVQTKAIISRVYSKTRKEYDTMEVEFAETFAKVTKQGTNNAYIVTKNSCTCHDHFYRGSECRHMKCVQDALNTVKYWVGE